MAERLKQIWGGFEQTTTRKLTGRGVDGIVMPQRAAERAREAASPEQAGVEAPAAAAFAALRADLDAKGRKHAAPPKPAVRGPGADLAEFADAPEAARDLVRGLASTEARIGRSFKAYDASMMAAPARKKKLFGLF